MVMTDYEWLEEFAANLEYCMKDAYMTQRELADTSGLSEATISKYLKRQQMPSVKAIINLSSALDIDVQELMPWCTRMI
jgi:transcriptional regulator with XRE-family HTH domain